MSDSDHIAVLDVGKTHAKLTVATASGEVLAEHRRANEPGGEKPYPHLDADGVFEWTVDRLGELGRLGPIGVIVPVTHGATAALMAGDELALPVLDYEFGGPEELAAEYPMPAFSETGSPPLPAGLNLGRQLYWQQRRFTEAFARVDRVLLYPQYFALRLTGRAAAEVTSLGCHTDLWAPLARCPSSLARDCGWDRLLPPLAFAGDRLGRLRAQLVERTGLPRRCEVLVGIHDSNASLWSHCARQEPPFAVLSTGTWIVALAAGGSLEGLDPQMDVLANVDAAANPIPTARFMGGRELEVLIEGRAPVPDLGASELRAIIERGTLALPSFARQGGPYRDQPGEITGPRPATDREWAALGILYCALMTDDALDRIGARGPCIIEGRFATTPAYGRLLAGLRPETQVSVATEATGTLSGALALAFPNRREAPAAQPAPCAPLDLPGLAALRDCWRREVAERMTR